MAKVNSLLAQRLKMATEKFSKMTSLVEMSSSGNLSSFSGVFRVSTLSEKEQSVLQSLLERYKQEEQEVKEDLLQLSALTAEVKAINNQAILLHGERIKRAQEILKSYKDGAFTTWLIATYGNRQTPYNFLQYYDLYCALPESLRTKIDAMPRQAAYTLASREGNQQQKEQVIENYCGEPKQEILRLIRETFPLSQYDKRAQDLADVAINTLKRLKKQLDHPLFAPSLEQREELVKLLKSIKHLTTHGSD